MFRFFFSAVTLFTLFITSVLPHPTPKVTLGRRAISQDLLDQFTRFTQFSSAAYQATCPSPLGTTLVQTIDNSSTNTQGYITRDDTNKQIVVAFRGSLQIQDFFTDANVILVPFESQGVTNTSDAKAHSGFLSAYNSVASSVISTVSSELSAHPDYTLISTGHSLGAALASLGGISLASNFPGTPLQVFTFGQPRTGNAEFAQLTETLIGTDNIFRAVHTTDGVPTIIPEALGYQHHGTEFWQFQDPPTADNIRQCSGDEDPDCSDSVPSGGIDLAHITYFGQLLALNSSLCS